MGRSLRIALINSFDTRGGAARSMWRLHQGLRGLGVESTVLCLHKQSSDNHCQQIQVERTDHAIRMRRKWAYAEQQLSQNLVTQRTIFTLPVPGYDLTRHHVVQDAEIIHLHWVAGMVSPETIAALQRLGKPVVWTLHDQRPMTGGCHYSGGCTRYEEQCSECPLLQTDWNHIPNYNLASFVNTVDTRKIIVVSPSRWLADCAGHSRAFSQSQIHVIPYGVDTDLFRPINRSLAHQWLGIEPASVNILFGAQDVMDPRKGISTLIASLHACEEDPVSSPWFQSGRVRCLLFGSGVSQLGRPPWLHNVGNVNSDEKLSMLYSAADVFICPTVEDNFPNTILESMSCGTPVIASRVGGVPDLVSDEVNGWLVEPGDAVDMTSKIKNALAHPSRLKVFSTAARRKAETHYSLERQAFHYVKLYQTLL